MSGPMNDERSDTMDDRCHCTHQRREHHGVSLGWKSLGGRDCSKCGCLYFEMWAPAIVLYRDPHGRFTSNPARLVYAGDEPRSFLQVTARNPK